MTHPTFSLNHNWLNSHNLPQIYESLSQEVERCREAICDVKELLIEKARREGKNEEEEGWRSEWEEAVDGLVERSEGWRSVNTSLNQPELSQDKAERDT